MPKRESVCGGENRYHLGTGVLLVAAAFLSSCATLSKSECTEGDWRAIGFSDGESGSDSEKQVISTYKSVCEAQRSARRKNVSGRIQSRSQTIL